MTMNPTIKENQYKEDQMKEDDKMTNSTFNFQRGKHAAQTQTEGKGNGNGSTNTNTNTNTPSDAAPHKASSTPIFIDVDTLELTIINGNQEIYHQNCYGRFGCRGGDDDGYDGEDFDGYDDDDFDGEGCGYCIDDDCVGEDCDDFDAEGCTWEDDEFDGDEDDHDDDRDDGCSSTDETAAAADASDDSPHCPSCGFSAECLKTGIESGDNIYIDQIIKELAKIAGVPIGPAIRMMNGYFGLCSIFDEDPVGRFKKSKFDAKRLPVKKSDAMTRIHNAAVTLAYGMGDVDKGVDGKGVGGKDVGGQRTSGLEKAADAKAGAVTQTGNNVKTGNNIKTGNNVKTGKTDKATASHPNDQEKTREERVAEDDMKAFLEEAPEPMKALVDILHKMGGNVRVYKIDLDGGAEDTSDDVSGTYAVHTGKCTAHTHTAAEVPSHE